MALIELTAEQRNGVPFAKTILVNTDTIAVPIREVGGKSYIGVNENILDGRPSERIDIVYYLVTEDLATVVASSYALFSGTVTTRDGRTPSSGYDILIFRLDRVVGNVIAEGSGSKFLYHEDNGSEPVEFVVAETPSFIISQVTPPVTSQLIKIKTFSLNADDIENNLPMMLELESSGLCILLNCVWDFRLNEGIGITDGGTFNIADTTPSNFFTNFLFDTDLLTQNNTQTPGELSNEYELKSDVLTAVDPLTTLDITIYYIIK